MTRLCCTCVGRSLASASRSRMRPSLPGHVSGADERPLLPLFFVAELGDPD